MMNLMAHLSSLEQPAKNIIADYECHILTAVKRAESKFPVQGIPGNIWQPKRNVGIKKLIVNRFKKANCLINFIH